MLAYRYKYPGYFLVLTGIIFLVLYYAIDLRFKMPVFAIVSSFVQTKFMTTFSTNFSDELIFILLLTGFGLLTFSKEKAELEFFPALRYKALIKTIITDIFFMFFTVLFFYGAAFLMAVLINFILPFVIYLIIFNFLRINELRKV
jgi:hypothetical protein